jgi:protein YibB
MIKDVTLVTALFDIGRDKWENYHLSYETYLNWFNNILKYDNNFVIFTEKKFKDRIINFRKKIDPELKKTIIIESELENLESHKKYYQKVKQVMCSESFKKKIHFHVPEMTKPLYNIVIFNKLYYIKECIEKNYFNSDMYIWVDAGLIRDNVTEIQKNWPNMEKINNGYSDKITFFNHQNDIKIHNIEHHILGQMRFIHGGCFLIPKNSKINELIDTFESLIEYYINNNLIGAEEKYYDLCYIKNPENYNLIKSDWRQYFNIFS